MCCRLANAAAVQHGLGRLDSVLRAADRPRSSSSHTSIVHPAAVALSSRSEADLGMFSMFGRTAAPQKGGPQIRLNDLTRYCGTGWWRGTVVERRSLAGELSLSCARPAADG